MLPGPVPIPERVRFAMSRQAINHRSAEFGAAYAAAFVYSRLRLVRPRFFFVIQRVRNGSMEAAIANVGKDKHIACNHQRQIGERLLKDQPAFRSSPMR